MSGPANRALLGSKCAVFIAVLQLFSMPPGTKYFQARQPISTMSAIPQTTVSKPLILRNSRILLGLLFISALIGFLGVPCFGVLALTSVFPVRHFSFDRVVGALSWLVAAFFSGSMGLFLWRHSFRMARNQVRLGAEGVHFRIRSANHAAETFFAWSDIASITQKRTPNNVHVCAVVALNRQTLTFTSLTFFRPKHIAREIAAYAGKNVTRA